ncbi:oocyte-secreted protein 4B [Microcebus murinus]|uniref:oocyte-secreted protein 4B n=1 Tax=Microcebus murinus TaxID=30608 RepID=UPI003F6CA7A1
MKTPVLLAILSTCSEDWLLVRVKRRLSDDEESELRSDEIYLGDHCPVTGLGLDNYEFSYPVTHCGIKKIVVPGNDIVILSEINFIPVLDTLYDFPVICFVRRRKAPSSLHFGMNGYEVKAVGDGSQGTKEGQAASAPSQSQNCELTCSSTNSSHLSMKRCTNNARVMTPIFP